MRKLLKFKDGSEYITGGIASIEPNGISPIEEYDLTNLKPDEIEQLTRNKKNKTLLKKAIKL